MAAAASLACPLCLSTGEVLETDIDEQEETEVNEEGEEGPPPATPPASVTCPVCDGTGAVPAGVGFEELTDEDGAPVLDDGGAAREMFEWIAAVEEGDVWGAS